MRGEVIGFDPTTNTGAIIGHDAKRYDFIRMDWRMNSVPRAGDEVDFAIEGDTAKQIFLVQSGQASAMAATGAVAGPAGSSGSLGWLWFSFSGRATRFDFWVRYVLIAMGLAILAAVAGQATGGPRGQVLFQGIASLVMLIPGIAVQVKRLHDRNMTGFHVLIVFVLYAAAIGLVVADIGPRNLQRLDPRDLVQVMQYEAKFLLIPGIYAFVLFIIMGFFRGTVGPNKYGEDPLTRPPR